jgi:hypothetical protein
MGDRKYVEIPGAESHELPPFLIRQGDDAAPREEVFERAAAMVDAEDMIPEWATDDAGARRVEQRKFDLAVHLSEQYFGLVSLWTWGDSALEWIRQCEITLETNDRLRHLLHPDVWPHASRASFVSLLAEKHVEPKNAPVEKAVGLRLTFRQPPPIDCFSNQFLFLLNGSVADSAYQTWSRLAPMENPALLPPERFHFQVHELN